VEEFAKDRTSILSGTKLQREVATEFAAKVIQSTQIIRENYVKPISQADLVGWAIRGLYRQIDEKIPQDMRERLEGIKNLDERQLTTLLADVRESLGQREDLDTHKDIDFALQRMLSHLDPYTTYFDPDTVARFQQETTGRFPGIGIQIRENRSRGGLMVISPIKGSPAYKAGILAGDLITTITRTVDKDGKPLSEPEVISTKGMSSTEAVKKITGKPDTKVSVTVEREGTEKPITFELVRAFVEVETVTGVKRNSKDEWDYYVDPANKICYVRVTTFARNTFRDLKQALSKLDKDVINGFILDLRFNPGGLLTSAVDISDLFIDDGLIVTIRNRAGKEVTYKKEITDKSESEKSFLNFPMVCLVNGGSASGSEIVSACLQDHDRALIMGERSYGKGSVQNIQPFEGGELKFTTASFHRPSGRNLNKSSTQGTEDEDWGVIPNPGFVLKLSEKERDQLFEHIQNTEVIQRKDAKKKDPEFKDKQLEMALDYLRGQIKKTPPKVTAKGE
jgi:carboxyl-terminal processing protease